MSSEGTHFCIDACNDGATLYCFPSKAFVESYEVKSMKKDQRVREVVFADLDREIVIGSDHHLVYVFNRTSGRFQTLVVQVGFR
jgi:hypothetical protein